MARAHPEGIDFLIVNAAISDAQHKSGIETCASVALTLHTLMARHARQAVVIRGRRYNSIAVMSLQP